MPKEWKSPSRARRRTRDTAATHDRRPRTTHGMTAYEQDCWIPLADTRLRSIQNSSGSVDTAGGGRQVLTILHRRKTSRVSTHVCTGPSTLDPSKLERADPLPTSVRRDAAVYPFQPASAPTPPPPILPNLSNSISLDTVHAVLCSSKNRFRVHLRIEDNRASNSRRVRNERGHPRLLPVYCHVSSRNQYPRCNAYLPRAAIQFIVDSTRATPCLRNQVPFRDKKSKAHPRTRENNT